MDFDSWKTWSTGIAAFLTYMRSSGWIKPPLSGSYRFHAYAPNMSVLVARKLVAGVGADPDRWVDFAAGRFYPIEITVSQLTTSAKRIRLGWKAPHGARYLTPKALHHLPTETVLTH